MFELRIRSSSPGPGPAHDRYQSIAVLHIVCLLASACSALRIASPNVCTGTCAHARGHIHGQGTSTMRMRMPTPKPRPRHRDRDIERGARIRIRTPPCMRTRTWCTGAPIHRSCSATRALSLSTYVRTRMHPPACAGHNHTRAYNVNGWVVGPTRELVLTAPDPPFEALDVSGGGVLALVNVTGSHSVVAVTYTCISTLINSGSME